MVQLSHLYVTTEKIVVLTLWTFVCKVISSLFNTLSRFVPPLVWTQCLPLYSGSGFRQPISQHFHSMVPKLAVRAKAQHGSRRQQFWEGLPEHRRRPPGWTGAVQKSPSTEIYPKHPQTNPCPAVPLGHATFLPWISPGAGLETSLMDPLPVHQPSWVEQDFLTVGGRISAQTG